LFVGITLKREGSEKKLIEKVFKIGIFAYFSKLEHILNSKVCWN